MKNLITYPFRLCGMLLKRLKYSLEIKYRTHTVYVLIIMIHWIYAYAYFTGSTFYEEYTNTVYASTQEKKKEVSEKEKVVTEVGTEDRIREQWEERTNAPWHEVWAVVQGESGWNSDAYNTNTNGTIDSGLYQLNSIHDIPLSCTINTVCATNHAIELYNEQGWCPWVASWSLGLCK